MENLPHSDRYRIYQSATSIRLNIPYYRQSAEFTCGPASILMVLKYFNPQLAFSKEIEFDIWRDCNMIGSRGADPFGLSIPFLKRGLNAQLITERKKIFPRERFRRHLGEEEIKLALFSIRHSYHKAKDLGLKIELRRPNIIDIRDALRHDRIPVVLVHMGVVHGFDIPHWIVVTGIDNDNVWINDPYPPRGRKNLRLTINEFKKIVNDIAHKMKSSRSLLIIDSNKTP